MVTVDNIMNNLKTDVNSLLTNAQTALNNLITVPIPPTVPPTTPPTTNVLLEDNFTTDYQLTKDGQLSPNNLWKAEYLGGGKAWVSAGKMNLAPGSTTNTATLLLTTATFKNFSMTFEVTNLEPTYDNGRNEIWRSAWQFWRYNRDIVSGKTHSMHHYYFIERSGGENNQLGKKDNEDNPRDDTIEKEVYLDSLCTTLKNVKVPIGVTAKVKIEAKENNHKVYINDVLVRDFTDNKVLDPRMNEPGYIGLYTESRHVQYANVKVVAV